MLKRDEVTYSLVGDRGEEDSGFREAGLPREVCELFQAAANQTRLVVLGRAPGPSCTRLVEEGHDVKGAFVRARACDWGPMAGVVCQLPPFNALGTAGEALAQHARENDRTFQFHNHVQGFVSAQHRAPEDTEVRVLMQRKDRAALGRAQVPFVHLKLSEAHKSELLGRQQDVECVTSVDRTRVYGIAWSANRTVCMEFLLLREGALWGLYHGEVFTRPLRLRAGSRVHGVWTSFLERPEAAALFPSCEPDGKATSRVLLERLLARLREETRNDVYRAHLLPTLRGDPAFRQDGSNVPGDMLALFDSGPRPFYPVLGVKNPYPAWRTDGTRNPTPSARGTDFHQNAVTGDYALFAVWPGRARDRSGLIRRSERGTRRFFLDAQGVDVELVPRVGEPQTLEDLRWGNASGNVLLASGTLNALFAGWRRRTRGPGASPGEPFHDDEGGRAGLDSLELPLVAFLPGGNGSFSRCLLRREEDFVGLLQHLKQTHTLVVHAGWLYHLVAHAPHTAEALRRVFGVTPAQVKTDVFAAHLRGADITEDLDALRSALGLHIH